MNSGKEEDKYLSDYQMKVFLWAFGMLLLFLIILYSKGSVKKSDAYDFISYALPCGAAILAGSAIYKNAEILSSSTDKKFFSYALVLLYLGVIFYAASHRTCSSPSMFLSCIFYALSSLAILIMRICSKGPERDVGFFFIGFVFVMSVALFVLCLFSLLGLSYMFIGGFDFFCTEQAA